MNARILARVIKQATINDYFVDVDGCEEVDVTDAVLDLPLRSIQTVEDNRESADALVEGSPFTTAGPYRVEVVRSIERYFGVTDLCQVTADMLDQARHVSASRPWTEWAVSVSRTATRYATMRVQARSATEARALAMAKAGDVEFASEADADYSVESALCVGAETLLARSQPERSGLTSGHQSSAAAAAASHAATKGAAAPPTESAALRLISTIENTGGLIAYADGTFGPECDPDWIDLGKAYLAACAEVGKDPVVHATQTGGAFDEAAA